MTVSVVIPVYNGARWLTDSMNSALGQGAVVSELIVVDDGSNDDSFSIAQAHSDPRVQVLQQSNGGAPSARNLALQKATGPYVAFLDADDLWRPDKLVRQIRCFEADDGLGVVTSLMQNFWIPGLEAEAEENPALKRPQPGVASTFIARKSVFDECGLLDTKFSNRDIQEWIVRVKRSGWEHLLVDEVLVDRRIHDANDSRVRQPGEDELMDLASRLLQARRKTKSEKRST